MHEYNNYGNGSINLVLSYSANTTVTGSPNLISSDDAKAIVAEAAPPGPPKPIEPEGMHSNITSNIKIYDNSYYSYCS